MAQKVSRAAPKKEPRPVSEREALRVADAVANHRFIVEDCDMPIVPRLGKAQARYLLAVIRLGNDAYNARIRDYLKKTHRKEYKDGHLSTIADALVHHRMILENKNGGIRSNGGRPVILYKVTRLALLALRQAFEFLDEMEEDAGLAPSEAEVPEPRGSGRGGGTPAARRSPRLH